MLRVSNIKGHLYLTTIDVLQITKVTSILLNETKRFKIGRLTNESDI